MDHEGFIIRPPAEHDSILLEVAVGCSHNRCAFCAAFKGERFRFKPLETIVADLAWAASHCHTLRHVFLCGGDGLILPQPRLVTILAMIRDTLPWVSRVGIYGSAKAVARKSDQELAVLRELGLGLVSMGLESGDDVTLARMGKGVDAAAIVAQARRVKAAGIKASLTVILGLGGVERSAIHAQATGQALTAADPQQASALTLMVVPGTPLAAEQAAGRFVLPDARQMLQELRLMLAHTTLSRGLFLSNHASNYLPLKVRLPRDKDQALAAIDAALDGRTGLRPEAQRRL